MYQTLSAKGVKKIKISRGDLCICLYCRHFHCFGNLSDLHFAICNVIAHVFGHDSAHLHMLLIMSACRPAALSVVQACAAAGTDNSWQMKREFSPPNCDAQ